jgi:hypothetical protein
MNYLNSKLNTILEDEFDSLLRDEPLEDIPDNFDRGYTLTGKFSAEHGRVMTNIPHEFDPNEPDVWVDIDVYPSEPRTHDYPGYEGHFDITEVRLVVSGEIINLSDELLKELEIQISEMPYEEEQY